MSNIQGITIRSSQTYLFSYVWLALELFLFHFIIYNYFPEYPEFISTVFFLGFARAYYWLDFSTETGFQTFFILGMIPIYFLIDRVEANKYHEQIVILYLVVFIALGSIRIAVKKYRFTRSKIIVQFIGSKIFETDQSGLPELTQHSRGKLLNFGCILMPVVVEKKKTDYAFSVLLFRKRYDAKYSGYLRIDGIRNPREVIKQIKDLIQLENT